MQSREERNKKQLAYYYKNKSREKIRQSNYYANNREHASAVSLAYYYKNKDKMNARRREKRREAGYTPSPYRGKRTTPDPSFKIAILKYYGEICLCCGESCSKLLTVDHINDNGKEHGGKNTRFKGESLYRHLIFLGYPKGIQILCFNCNIGRRNNNGICPHKA